MLPSASAAFQPGAALVVAPANAAPHPQATSHSQAVDPGLERARKQLKLDQEATQQMLFQTPFSTVLARTVIANGKGILCSERAFTFAR